MLSSLAVGLEKTSTFLVTEELSPPHLPGVLLSTPHMVGLIEDTCLACVQPHLEEDEITVGIHIDVSHVGSAYTGESVAVRCRIQDVYKRKLRFEIEVTAPSGLISTGSHQRMVIARSRLPQPASNDPPVAKPED